MLQAIVARRRRLAPEERLFRIGDPMTSVFVARSGTFKAAALTAGGEETILGFFLPGELMGLDGLGTGRHRCETVALEPADICEIDFEALITTAARLPRLRAQLHRVVGQNIARDHEHATLLVRKLAHERVAGFLDDLSDRYCLLGSQGTAFRLPMSREDIARFLGLTLESVSRALGRLQDEAVLHVKGRQLDILDPVRLAQMSARLT